MRRLSAALRLSISGEILNAAAPYVSREATSNTSRHSPSPVFVQVGNAC